MFKFIFKISLVSILFLSLVTSCSEDSTLGGGTTRPVEEEPAGPAIGLVAGVGLISSATSVPAGSDFTVRLSAQAGEAALKTVTVLENGTTMPFSRLKYNNPNIGANPTLILDDALKTALTWDITITTPTTEQNNSYSFEVADDNDKVDVVFLNITTEPAVLVGPDVQLQAGAGFLSGSSVIYPSGAPFTLLVIAKAGSAPIHSVTVLEDGLPIQDLARIQGNGTGFPANPWNFSEGLPELELEVTIMNATDGKDHRYEVVITDARETSTVVGIDILAPAGTSLTNSLVGKLLLNQAGPAGTGGINLFTGESIGSSSATATIRDEGIDLSLPATSNWKRQISGVNGSVIRTISTSQPETFRFSNVQSKEEIINLYDTGDNLLTKNDQNRLVTAFVIVGDVFVVNNGDTYFLVEVTGINQTEDNNNDYYELSIKY